MAAEGPARTAASIAIDISLQYGRRLRLREIADKGDEIAHAAYRELRRKTELPFEDQAWQLGG